jgi:dTDP-4-dehydrorhamnose 3,5-epimerase
MIFKELPLKGAYLIVPQPFHDERGFFTRAFCVEEFRAHNLEGNFVQMNHSGTIGIGSVRGMHFQYPPYCEVKCVKCVKGSIYDVIIDLRKESPTYLQWFGAILSEENKEMMYVPQGFAHGFQTLTENAEITYLVSQFYNKGAEGIINHNDPLLKIDWQLPIANISEKDKAAPFIADSNFKGILF